jgi:hypothetical protein
MGFFQRTAALLFAALVLLAPAGRAEGAVVDALYEAVVAGDSSDAGRPAAAVEALREVLPRLTGRRGAATDPAFAAVVREAPRFAASFRAAGPGQIAVGFDPALLDARLLQAGLRIWPRERPLTLVVIVSSAPGASHTLLAGADADLRRDMVAAAQLRGLPIVWPAGLPAALEQSRVEDALAGRLEPLRDLARGIDADGVLVGRTGGATIAWSWLGPAGTGTFSGPGGEAVHALADRLAAQYASGAPAAGRIAILVRGVRDLGEYAQAFAAIGRVAAVRGAVLEEATADSMRFRVSFDGDPDALRAAIRDSGRLAVDDVPGPAGSLAVVLKP